MKHLFLLATITMITVKMSFTDFHSSSYQGNIFLHQNHAIYSPNYNWENGVKQIRLLKESSYLRLFSGSKRTKHFFLIFTTICLISAEWMWLFNMSCLSLVSLMASLDIFCFNPFNLKNRIRKIEHKEIFCGPSKLLKNISWSNNICLKYFMTPTKPSPLPPPFPSTYLMYDP